MLVKGYPGELPSSLLSPVGSGRLDQDTAHLLRRNGEEVRLSGPADPAVIDQAQVRLMDQFCGLKGVPGSLLSEVSAGEGPELVVDER